MLKEDVMNAIKNTTKVKRRNPQEREENVKRVIEINFL